MNPDTPSPQEKKLPRHKIQRRKKYSSVGKSLSGSTRGPLRCEQRVYGGSETLTGRGNLEGQWMFPRCFLLLDQLVPEGEDWSKKLDLRILALWSL